MKKHSITARIIHWGFAGVFIYALTKQLDEVEELEDFALLQQEMVFASLFLVLLLARFVYMRSTQPTLMPAETPKKIRLLARCCHLGMYISLSFVALSGLMIGGLYWSGTTSGMGMEFVLVVHELAVIASYYLIGLHIAGALYHRRLRDGIWSSMVPFWKEPPAETVNGEHPSD